MLTRQDIEDFLRRRDGSFLFRRWRAPIRALVMGTTEITQEHIDKANAQLADLTGHPVAQSGEPNQIHWFVNDWRDLFLANELSPILGNVAELVQVLEATDSGHRRMFIPDDSGAIGSVFSIVNRKHGSSGHFDASSFALRQAVNCHLQWTDSMSRGAACDHDENGQLRVRPPIADLLVAAYRPDMPDVSEDDALIERLLGA